MPQKQSTTSRLSLDLDRGTFTKPFANGSSSRSLQSRRSSSSLLGSLAKGFTTRKTPAASKLRDSSEQDEAKLEQQESAPPSPTIIDSKPTSAPLPPTKTNPHKLQSFMTRFKFASRFQKSSRNPPKSEPAPPTNPKSSHERRREAALRACGLKPQKDLSQLEKEHDLLIDAIDGRIIDFDESKGQSAADEIKRAWELKNAESLAPTGLLPFTPQDVPLVDPCQVPLPRSPAPVISDLPVTEAIADPCSIPLPPSPSIGPVRPKNPNASFRDWKFPTSAPTPHTPVTPHEDSLLVPPSPIAETDSVMNASIVTPSLVADSIAPTTSVMSVGDISDSISATTSTNELRVHTSIAPGVEVIVESPIEETSLSVIPESEEVTCPKESSPDPPCQERRSTDQGQTKPKKPHKLTLRILQRSVIGTLSSKPKSPRSEAPPLSPQLPTSPRLRLPLPTRSATTVTPRSPPIPRTPRSPTIYSPSAIVLEANNIEDEESRRLSEMAFLT